MSKELIINQLDNNYRFSQDIHFLSDFVVAPINCKIIEFGTGSGVISLLLMKKNPHISRITALEIQEEQAKIAKENVILNNYQEKIEILNLDVREIRKHFQQKSYDIVVSNPPFYKVNNGIKPESHGKKISNFEYTLTLDNLFDAARYVLKDNGNIYIIHKPERLDDIIETAIKYKMNVRELKFIHYNLTQDAVFVLCRILKNPKNKGIKVLSPILIENYDFK